jgi:excisionase family DNA binding protein
MNFAAPIALTVRDAARKLQVSEGFIRRLIRDELLTSVKIGRRCRRIPVTSLERLLREGVTAR